MKARGGGRGLIFGVALLILTRTALTKREAAAIKNIRVVLRRFYFA